MWFQDGEIRRGVEPFTISLAVCQSYAADTPRKLSISSFRVNPANVKIQSLKEGPT